VECRRFGNNPVGHRAEKYREVLVLYRKRESASSTHEHGVFARFRYNDLKEDAGVCGRGGLVAMGIQSFRPSVSYWFCGT
jgi:hypothetical protein